MPSTRKPIGHTILRFEQISSTNTFLMEERTHLENHGLVAIAAHQTAGRGRIGRRWASLPGRQLQFSLVLHPLLAREQVAVLSPIIGLAVGRCLRDRFGLRPRLKWPNDVFLGGRKVCGILVEMKQGPGGAPRLVVGIGLNCQGAPEDFPPEVSGLLTTLAHEAGREVNMEEVFQALLAELEATLGSLTKERLPLLLQAWEEMAAMKGRPLRYPVQEGMRPGKALELTTEGQLLIETAEGAHHIHSSGELEWLD